MTRISAAFCIITTIVIMSLLAVALSFAEPVTITADDLAKSGVYVTGFVVESGPVVCELEFCDPFDKNCDGVLDETCPGLTYDICSPTGVADAYQELQQAGKTCESLLVDPCDADTIVSGLSCP
jgi:hypothetical protein